MGRNRNRRASAVVLAGLAVVLVGLGAAPAFGQGAQTNGPPPITDYANYPLNLGLIPNGCTAQGADVVNGEQFSVNGSAPVGSMRDLGEVPSGATVTMTWESFAPGCEGVGISLSRKISASTDFNAADVQYLNAWSYCGPDGTPCGAPGSLTLNLAGAGEVACYQLDANIGPPLNVVGPNTAYYSLGSAFNMLISAKNGGTAPCTPAPCAMNPEIPATAAECQEVTTTTTTAPPPPPTTVTTAPAVTTTAPPPPAAAPTTTVSAAPSCAANQRLDVATGQCVTVLASSAALPFTGSRASDLARVGGLFLLAGGLFVAAARRWRVPASPSV